MQAQDKEVIESLFEGAKDRFPPQSRQLIKDNLIKMLDEGLTIKEAFGISDQLMETFYNQGYNLYQAGKYREAARIFEFLRKLNTTDARYSLATAACYHYLGEYSNAIANYYICKETDPFNPIPCFHLYDCFMKLDKPIAATDALTETIVKAESDPIYQALKEKALLEKENLIEYLKVYMNKIAQN